MDREKHKREKYTEFRDLGQSESIYRGKWAEKTKLIFSAFPNCILRSKVNYKHGYTVPL